MAAWEIALGITSVIWLVLITTGSILSPKDIDGGAVYAWLLSFFGIIWFIARLMGAA